MAEIFRTASTTRHVKVKLENVGTGHYAANKRPMIVMGIVNKTGIRSVVPEPICRFNCSATPFQQGHVFGWDIGGTDDSENIVPMYRIWQASGSWRTKVELAVKNDAATNGGIFVARLTYDVKPDQDIAHRNAYANFHLFEWEDSCIPSSMTVWVVKTTDPEHGPLHTYVTAPNAGAADVANFDIAFATVKDQHKLSHMPIAHQPMPPEDREFLQNRIIGEVSWTAYNDYVDTREAQVQGMMTTIQADPLVSSWDSDEMEETMQLVQDGSRSPQRDEDVYMVSFVDEIRAELADQNTTRPGTWLPHELTSVNQARIMKSSLQTSKNNPNATRAVKSRNKRVKDYSVGITKPGGHAEQRKRLKKKMTDKGLTVHLPTGFGGKASEQT